MSRDVSTTLSATTVGDRSHSDKRRHSAPHYQRWFARDQYTSSAIDSVRGQQQRFQPGFQQIVGASFAATAVASNASRASTPPSADTQQPPPPTDSPKVGSCAFGACATTGADERWHERHSRSLSPPGDEPYDAPLFQPGPAPSPASRLPDSVLPNEGSWYGFLDAIWGGHRQQGPCGNGVPRPVQGLEVQVPGAHASYQSLSESQGASSAAASDGAVSRALMGAESATLSAQQRGPDAYVSEAARVGVRSSSFDSTIRISCAEIGGTSRTHSWTMYDEATLADVLRVAERHFDSTSGGLILMRESRAFTAEQLRIPLRIYGSRIQTSSPHSSTAATTLQLQVCVRKQCHNSS